MLVAFSEEQQLPEVGTVTAEDQMDDGTPIRVIPRAHSTKHPAPCISYHLQHLSAQISFIDVVIVTCPSKPHKDWVRRSSVLQPSKLAYLGT